MCLNDRKNKYIHLIIITTADSNTLLYIYASQTFDETIRIIDKYKNEFYRAYPIEIRLKNNIKIYNERVDILYDYKDIQ